MMDARVEAIVQAFKALLLAMINLDKAAYKNEPNRTDMPRLEKEVEQRLRELVRAIDDLTHSLLF